jgi:soluble cytochrome b562
LASLTGGAGIGLAISAVTSLITAFSIGLFDNKDAVSQDTAALDAMNKTLADSKEGFDALIASMEQANRLGSINIEIQGAGKVQDLQEQSIANRNVIEGSLEREKSLWGELQRAQAAFNAQSTSTNWMGVIEAVTPAKQYGDAVEAASKALGTAKRNRQAKRYAVHFIPADCPTAGAGCP